MDDSKGKAGGIAGKLISAAAAVDHAVVRAEQRLG